MAPYDKDLGSTVFCFVFVCFGMNFAGSFYKRERNIWLVILSEIKGSVFCCGGREVREEKGDRIGMCVWCKFI